MEHARQQHTDASTPQAVRPILLQTTIRSAHDCDGPRLVDFFLGLSSETLYLRYFTPRPPHTVESAWAEAQRLVHSDGSIDVLLATMHDNSEEQVIGIAEVTRTPSSTDRLETALIVTDIYQGQGIGQVLCRKLIDLLTERGVSQIHSVVLPENTRMRRLIDRMGFAYTAHLRDGALFFCFTPNL